MIVSTSLPGFREPLEMHVGQPCFHRQGEIIDFFPHSL